MKIKKHKFNAIIYNVVLHILPYSSFVTNNIFLLLMFTVTYRKTSNFDMCFQKFRLVFKSITYPPTGYD